MNDESEPRPAIRTNDEAEADHQPRCGPDVLKRIADELTIPVSPPTRKALNLPRHGEARHRYARSRHPGRAPPVGRSLVTSSALTTMPLGRISMARSECKVQRDTWYQGSLVKEPLNFGV